MASLTCPLFRYQCHTALFRVYRSLLELRRSVMFKKLNCHEVREMKKFILSLSIAIAFLLCHERPPIAQPPGQLPKPPEGKSHSDIYGEIEMLRFIKRWKFSKAQLELAYKLVVKLRQLQEEIDKAYNSPQLIALLWRARMALLYGEDPNPWLEKADELQSKLVGEIEEAYNKLQEQALNELRGALNNEQESKMAIEGTVWERLNEIVSEFVEVVKADEDRWVEWRTSVTSELRAIARAHNPNVPKDVDDQITILLIRLKQIAIEQPQQAKADLHKRLLALVLPEEMRLGPTKEEAEERIRSLLNDNLLSDLRAAESVLNDLLKAK